MRHGDNTHESITPSQAHEIRRAMAANLRDMQRTNQQMEHQI